jgi:hypothetical protein
MRGITLLAGLLALALAGPAAAQDYIFPTTPADYGHWYPTAYKDHGGQDWNCGNIYYSGHNGSDYGAGSWSGMDAGRDIVAAADGVVEYTNDGVADDCSTGDCGGGGGYGNYVKLAHADGKVTYYAHMKTWSVAVSTGDAVSCGQKLGELGSSGNSTGPHLHFEVRVDNVAHDPFDGPCSAPPSYWTDQGAHGGLPGLTCDGSEPCAPISGLECGVPLDTANNGGGSTTSVVTYNCTEYTYTGPEIAYAWTSAHDEEVSVSLSGHTADVDLFVLNGPGCTPSDCIGASTHPETEAEVVTWNALAGQDYVVIVDGWEGAASSFQLLLDCTPPIGDDDDATSDDDDASPDDDDSATSDDDDAADDDDSGGAAPFFPEAGRQPSFEVRGAACTGCGAAMPGRVGACLLAVFGVVVAIGIRRWRL